MKFQQLRLLAIAILYTSSGFAADPALEPEAFLTEATPTAAVSAASLGRGLNLGATLEAYEGNLEGYLWGFQLKAEHFPVIKRAGFQHVRVPIGWSYSTFGTVYDTLKTWPYTIRPALFARVDWVVQQALRNGLAVIIDNHNHEEIYQNPVAEEERFLAIWSQIAEHYKNQPNTVYFELLNEPSDQLGQDPERWNVILNKALAIIRRTNPSRPIIVGGVGGNSAWLLPRLRLPQTDRNLIVTFHYYEPLTFTHQGASQEWIKPIYTCGGWITLPTGVPWAGTKPSFAIGPHSGMDFCRWPDATNYQLKPANSLAVDFPAWGGFKFFIYQGLTGFNTVSFTTNRAFALSIVCNDDKDDPINNPWKIINTEKDKTYNVSFNACNAQGNRAM